jgi:hypothetical protein
MAVLLESGGILGKVDTYSVQPSGQADADLPQTADGLGIGSTAGDVEDVYGADLQREESVYVEGGERLWFEDSGAGILFEVDADDVVTSITAGRLPQLRYIEGCA